LRNATFIADALSPMKRPIKDFFQKKKNVNFFHVKNEGQPTININLIKQTGIFCSGNNTYFPQACELEQRWLYKQRCLASLNS